MTARQGVPERLPGVKVHGHTLGHRGALSLKSKPYLSLRLARPREWQMIAKKRDTKSFA